MKWQESPPARTVRRCGVGGAGTAIRQTRFLDTNLGASGGQDVEAGGHARLEECRRARVDAAQLDKVAELPARSTSLRMLTAVKQTAVPFPDPRPQTRHRGWAGYLGTRQMQPRATRTMNTTHLDKR